MPDLAAFSRVERFLNHSRASYQATLLPKCSHVARATSRDASTFRSTRDPPGKFHGFVARGNAGAGRLAGSGAATTGRTPVGGGAGAGGAASGAHEATKKTKLRSPRRPREVHDG